MRECCSYVKKEIKKAKCNNKTPANTNVHEILREKEGKGRGKKWKDRETELLN